MDLELRSLDGNFDKITDYVNLSLALYDALELLPVPLSTPHLGFCFDRASVAPQRYNSTPNRGETEI